MLVILKRIALVLALLALASVLGVLFLIRQVEAGLPSTAELKHGYNPPQVTRVLARDGSVLASIFVERRTVVPFEEIPNHAKLAFLAAEDAGFYQHQGLNYFGMLRALWVNLRSFRTRQGASTITQQVVKNILLDPERTYQRKIKETILARRIERELSKDEIFWLYLNHIYLGHGRYGVEEAARYYFGKKAKDLDVSEGALLAGLVASPERFSPRHDEAKALLRRRYVLDQMLEKAFVTPELHARVKELAVRLAPAAEGESELAPELVGQVKKLLDEQAGQGALRGGYVVETTLDPALQAQGRRSLRDALDAYMTRQKLDPPFNQTSRKIWGAAFEGNPKPYKAYVGKVVALDDRENTIDVQVGEALGRIELMHEERYNAKHLVASAFTRVGAVLRVSLLTSVSPGHSPVPLKLELGPEGALVAIDPRTREVLALVGSYDAKMGGLDRASHALRQPGSAFKPLVYSYALHSRQFTPASVLELKPHGKDAEPYKRSVRAALAASDNGAAQKLLVESGPANVVAWAHQLGISANLQPTPSLALGAYEVTPLELCNTYAVFASSGQLAEPLLIRRITQRTGTAVSLKARPEPQRVMAAEEAYLTTSLLQSVVETGTAKRARSLGRPVAGKTGTTNQAKDAWFAGYSTDVVAIVWIGYDDPMPLGPTESGAVTALPAWLSFMKSAHEKRPATEFVRPPGVVVVRIDPASGLLAYPGQTDALDEEFLEGSVPAETASVAAAVPDAGALPVGDEPNPSPEPPVRADSPENLRGSGNLEGTRQVPDLQ